MPTFTATTTSGREFQFSIECQGVTNNCGACLLYGAHLRVYELPKPGGEKTAFSLEKTTTQKYCIFPSVNELTLKDLSDGLMAVWKNSKFSEWIESNCKGFAILTDNINYYLNNDSAGYANFLVDEDKLETTKASSLSTSGFVTWLVKNKVGAVGRGITTVNKRHPNSSVLTSWTWAPSNDMLLSMDQPLYPEGEVPQSLCPYPSLKKLAKGHNEREMKFGLTQAKVPNVKRATVHIPKRAGINTPRRIRKLP